MNKTALVAEAASNATRWFTTSDIAEQVQLSAVDVSKVLYRMARRKQLERRILSTGCYAFKPKGKDLGEELFYA